MNSILTHIPSELVPLVFAVLAAIAGAVLGHQHADRDAIGFASKILYAVALGCVAISLILWMMSR